MTEPLKKTISLKGTNFANQNESKRARKRRSKMPGKIKILCLCENQPGRYNVSKRIENMNRRDVNLMIQNIMKNVHLKEQKRDGVFKRRNQTINKRK